MQANSRDIRRTMRCGLEPLLPLSPDVSAWQPPTDEIERHAYNGPEATVCIGYTSKLPEVMEAAEARLHWEHGAIQSWCRGEPTEALLEGIAILHISTNQASAWAMSQRAPDDPPALDAPHEPVVHHMPGGRR